MPRSSQVLTGSLAIHRTFWACGDAGKVPIEPQKLMPCRGGVVRLARPGALLMIGKGLETRLSAMQATGHPAWAALSTAGLRSLDLPTNVRGVIMLADGDEPGEAAAQDCARRWKCEGRRVRIARPPMGMDFNDTLIPFRSGSPFTYPPPGKGPASVKATASAADRLADGGDLPCR
jgi:putative DNA primase/helicase